MVSAERNHGVVNLPPSDAKQPSAPSGKDDAEQAAKPANTDNSGGDQEGHGVNVYSEEETQTEYTELVT